METLPLGPYSAFNAFKQVGGGGVFIHTDTVTWDFGFSGLTQKTIPFSRLLLHTREYWGSILTRILISVAYYYT
jgi:hypothetical protein